MKKTSILFLLALFAFNGIIAQSPANFSKMSRHLVSLLNQHPTNRLHQSPSPSHTSVCVLMTLTNGASIFLPAAGNRNGASRVLVGSSGNYWSSTWGTSEASRASELIFDSSYMNTHTAYRYNGRSVRPVGK